MADVLQDPGLTIEDQELAKNIFSNNEKRILKDSKKNTFFSEVEEVRLVKKLDFAIQAVLQHRLTKRREGF